MNSRVRALVWEELRVGGPIAAVCLTVGLLLIVRVSSTYEFNWLRVEGGVLAIALGIPLLCGLLLVLNVRNSGHLGGGFSRRILRLPVDTGTAVTVTFGVRLAEMLALSLLLKLVCWLVYRHGPGWDAVLLVLAAYAFIQMLDWMRAVLSWPLTVLFAAVFAFIVQYSGLLDWWYFLTGVHTAAVPGVFVIAGWIALAYAVSVALVAWTRRGVCVTLWQQGEAVETRKGGGTAAAAATPFASLRAAHLWYHLRRNGLRLGSMTVLFWVGGVALYWLVDFYMGTGRTEIQFSRWLHQTRNSFFITQLMPLVAVMAAAAGWRLVSGVGERRRNRKNLSWIARLPMSRAEEARTRMTAAGISLAAVLAAVTLAYLVAYLVPQQFTAARLFGSVLAHNEASLREVAGAVLGPALLCGLLAWIAMNLPASLALVYAGVAVCAGLLWLGADSIDFLFREEHLFGKRLLSAFMHFAVWFVGLAPVVMLAVDLVVLARLGWIRRRSVLLCAGLWAGIALALYPFAWKLPTGTSQLAAVYCAGIAALTVLAWPERILGSMGGLRVALHRMNPEQHERKMGRAFSTRRAVQIATLLALLAGMVWLRWPTTPRTVEVLQEKGLPANVDEENLWYRPVPAAENLANRYLNAVVQRGILEAAWNVQAAGNPALQQAVKDSKSRDAMDNVLVQGNAKVKRAEPIPAEVWTTTKDYYEAVTKPVAEMLDEAAKSGLRQSRYPIDLRLGFNVSLPHLANLRALARELGVKASVAAVGRRVDDAAAAVLDTIPLANSLEGEPLIISQLVRIAIYGIAVGNLEWVMNRAELPDTVMLQLQEGLKQSVPPLEQGPFLSRAIAGEEAVALSQPYSSFVADDYVTAQTRNGAFTRKTSESELLRGALASIGADLLGMNKTERMVTLRLNQAIRDNAAEMAKTGRLPNTGRLIEDTAETMSYHAPIALITLPAFIRVYESEWRVRTQLNMACAALAVERYRLATGHLPTRLEELIPAYLDRVPTDPWNKGKPLSYRVKENGEFVLYSFAQNGTDENGEELTDTKKNWWRDGDMTFTVAPPEVRNRPQVEGEGKV